MLAASCQRPDGGAAEFGGAVRTAPMASTPSAIRSLVTGKGRVHTGDPSCAEPGFVTGEATAPARCSRAASGAGHQLRAPELHGDTGSGVWWLRLVWRLRDPASSEALLEAAQGRGARERSPEVPTGPAACNKVGGVNKFRPTRCLCHNTPKRTQADADEGTGAPTKHTCRHSGRSTTYYLTLEPWSARRGAPKAHVGLCRARPAQCHEKAPRPSAVSPLQLCRMTAVPAQSHMAAR